MRSATCGVGISGAWAVVPDPDACSKRCARDGVPPTCSSSSSKRSSLIAARRITHSSACGDVAGRALESAHAVRSVRTKLRSSFRPASRPSTSMKGGEHPDSRIESPLDFVRVACSLSSVALMTSGASP
eukprot:scaffold273599_cov35-Tisochrysis_lutea.AAC.2